MDLKWIKELDIFFDTRADEMISDEITLEKLCYVSGRDPRLWNELVLYDDMMQSIKEQLDIDTNLSLLEVGCAAGFLAKGLSELASHYTGVDISKQALNIAKTLGLKNATFKTADGTRLPFLDNIFDRAVSYDVFTNIPEFDFCSNIIMEMLRITKPYGKIMIGSLADNEKKEEYTSIVQKVSSDLESRFGPVKRHVKKKKIRELKNWYLNKIKKIEPKIVCYYFNKNDFISLGERLGIETEIFDIHPQNPYHGYRFNVVYTKLK